MCPLIHIEENIPFGMTVAGDKWLSNRLQEDAIDRFELMLIPELDLWGILRVEL